MSLSNLLYHHPGESRDASDPPLTVFRPSESFDSDSDYTNIEDPKQAGKANIAHLLSCMDPTRARDDLSQVPSADEASENGLDPYDSDGWVKAPNPSSPGGSNPDQRVQGGVRSANPMNLQELASKAVSHALRSDPVRQPAEMGREPSREGHRVSLAVREAPRHDGPAPPAPLRNITLPPRDFYPPADRFSPRQHASSVGGPPAPLTSPRSLDARSPTNSLPASESELPPLNSPSHGVSWLPSVKELMISEPRAQTPGRDDQPPPPLHSATFPHSMPGPGVPVPPLRPLSISAPHGTSPISQDGIHPSDLPSPLRPPGMYFYSSPNSGDGANLARLPNDYGSNGPDSPNDAPGRAESSGAGNDGGGEPGTYRCTFEGCQARPFQTQYLLNSHANVHSLERPHYCPVPGCPRGKAGQGFKRKNEMIRHGFVHRSPGYACPFCPDREHKYPRPDNLQRHVRSRHTDVDKNDPRLLEVLAQRPDGPSRGRRRRTAPS